MAHDKKDIAVSRWEAEGGALPCGPQEALAATCDEWDIPALSDAELIQLRIRVIALENIVLGLLSKAEERSSTIADITPRPDAKQHPLTIHAATQMDHMVERAKFRHDAECARASTTDFLTLPFGFSRNGLRRARHRLWLNFPKDLRVPQFHSCSSSSPLSIMAAMDSCAWMARTLVLVARPAFRSDRLGRHVRARRTPAIRNVLPLLRQYADG